MELNIFKLTIVDADGTITEIEIPIGIGTLGGKKLKQGLIAVLFALPISGCASVSSGDKVCGTSLLECIEEPNS